MNDLRYYWLFGGKISMKNDFFDIKFDKNTGGIYSLKLCGDKNDAEFIKEGKKLAELKCGLYSYSDEFFKFGIEETEEKDESAIAKFRLKRSPDEKGLTAETRFGLDGEKLNVTIIFKNENDFPFYFKDGDISFYLPFFDKYDDSETCIKKRVHAHINACGENSFIMLERMGENEFNVGLIFLKGNITSYSQEEVKSNDRGYFLMNVGAFALSEGEIYEISFVLFPFKDRKDFKKKLLSFEQYLDFSCKDGYTLLKGRDEKRLFKITAKKPIDKASVTLNGENLLCSINGCELTGELTYVKTGEAVVSYCVNGRSGEAAFFISPPIDDIIEKRLNFIIDNQQCKDKESSLYGAYLIYDNEENRPYYDRFWRDHNASRERFGMALSILAALKRTPNEKYDKSIKLFTDFLFRECVDEETGAVYDGIGKDARYIRLYNAPWVALFFTELYNYTSEPCYVRIAANILKRYYQNGGTKFYPNGVRFYDFFSAFVKVLPCGETAEIMRLFDEHVSTIIDNGVIYPPHEVNFEQTIATPATSILLDKYAISKDKKYLDEAEKHLNILRKFDGVAPNHRLNKIPIRFWDDYWFGKERTFGDTFPHYWSVLSGICNFVYGQLLGKSEYFDYGRQCMENCLCLFREDGKSSCAYVYPKKVNGKKGAFFDPFANDQDFALYFLLKTENSYIKT